MTSIPEPPIGPEVDLRDFAFMPLDVARLRRSRAWLICKRRPELAFYMMNLWTAAWHDTPAGSLEDDDDVLADLAMCDPKAWPKLRPEVLRGWTKCSDGRLYHPIVVEKAMEGWRSKLQNRYDRACGALRKAWNRAGKKDFIPPTFEEWSASLAPEMSQGHLSMSQGQSKDMSGVSAGQLKDMQSLSQESPQENALKVRDRDSKGIGTGTHMGQVVSPGQGQDTDTAPHETAVRLAYPPCSHTCKWLEALRACRAIVERGEATWEELLEFTRTYAAFVAAGGVSGPDRVLTPQNFFGSPERLWKQSRELPKSKAETRLASNLTAAEEFMRRTEPAA